MAYNSNIPQAGDLISVSQGQILANFQAIKALIDVNHVDFANAGNMGKHIFVTFTDQSASPPVATGTDINIFNALSSLTGDQELFLGNAAFSFPFTAGNRASVGPSGFQPGWTNLPSGFLLKWGPLGLLPANTATVVNFPTIDTGATPIPAFPTACVGALAVGTSGGNPTQIITVQNVTTTQITVYNRPFTGTASTTAFFFAIGY